MYITPWFYITLHTNHSTNFMKRCPLWQANSSTVDQQMPGTLWNLKVYHHVLCHWFLSCHINTVHNPNPYDPFQYIPNHSSFPPKKSVRKPVTMPLLTKCNWIFLSILRLNKCWYTKQLFFWYSIQLQNPSEHAHNWQNHLSMSLCVEHLLQICLTLPPE